MAAKVAYESSHGVFLKASYSSSPPRRRNRRAARISSLALSGISSPKSTRFAGKGGELIDLGAVQKALGHQIVQVDQQRVAGERRRRLIWRIPISGRAHRQHLPEVLTGVCQRPCELGGRLRPASLSRVGREGM